MFEEIKKFQTNFKVDFTYKILERNYNNTSILLLVKYFFYAIRSLNR